MSSSARWACREPQHSTLDRPRAQHVVEDRDVVRGEVPDDVDVVLVEPHVQARGVQVVEVPEVAAGRRCRATPTRRRGTRRCGRPSTARPLSRGGSTHRCRVARVGSPAASPPSRACRPRWPGRASGACVLGGVAITTASTESSASSSVSKLVSAGWLRVSIAVRSALGVDHAHVRDLGDRTHRPHVLGAPVAGPDDPDAQSCGVHHVTSPFRPPMGLCRVCGRPIPTRPGRTLADPRGKTAARSLNGSRASPWQRRPAAPGSPG